MSAVGIVSELGVKGPITYATKKGNQQIINPPTTAAKVCAVFVSLLKEAIRPLEKSLVAVPPL